MRWSLVAFDHPKQKHSLSYRQDLTEEALLRAVQTAIRNGANLFSIRGFDD